MSCAHHLNNMRKEAGLDISDRIAIRYAGNIARVFERYGDFIKQEALATSFAEGLHARGHKWEGELNGVKGQLEIEELAETGSCSASWDRARSC